MTTSKSSKKKSSAPKTASLQKRTAPAVKKGVTKNPAKKTADPRKVKQEELVPGKNELTGQVHPEQSGSAILSPSARDTANQSHQNAPESAAMKTEPAQNQPNAPAAKVPASSVQKPFREETDLPVKNRPGDGTGTGQSASSQEQTRALPGVHHPGDGATSGSNPNPFDASLPTLRHPGDGTK